MATGQHRDLWRYLRHGASLLGIVALTVLAMRMFGLGQAAAQPAQQGDIRATSFTLVGPDGTILAKLAPGGSGNGNLTVFDTAGRPRASITGAANVQVFDTDGRRRAALVDDGSVQAFDINGRMRIAAGYSVTLDRAYESIYDGNGPGSGMCIARATLHQRLDGSYVLDVCDVDGNVIYTAP